MGKAFTFYYWNGGSRYGMCVRMDFCLVSPRFACALIMMGVVGCNPSSTTGTGPVGDGGTGNSASSSGASGGGTSSGGGGGGGGGQARTLGPEMTSEPSSEWRCSDGYPIQINPSFPQPFNEPGAQSCTLVTFLPPVSPAVGSGTAVSANIKVGATTGPMRFLRMRLLYQNGTGPKCCSLQEYGETFTPTAGTTTTVPLNFKMTEESVPPPTDTTSIVANDTIALEVLSPTVPIPGHWPSNGAQVPDIANYLWLPSLTSQKAAAPTNLLNYTAGFSGFVPLFTISYVPD
jgi:hypothetical protein